MLRATLKSLLARKLRLVLSGLAVVLGVMFVSGAFVLTDTLGRSFDAVFSSAYSQTDVGVAAKPKIEMSEMEGEEVQAPFPASVLDEVRSVPGVAKATGTVSADGAQVIGSNGKVLTSFGPPQIGQAWTGEDGLTELREGRGPTADNEIAVNVTVADAAKIKVGDQVRVQTLEPAKPFTLVGIFGYSGGRDSLGGVQEVAFTEKTAQQLLVGETGVYTGITVKADSGVSHTKLRDEISTKLGGGYEVKTGQQLSDEASDSLKEGLAFFNNILLGFAGVALFVGIFLILNTFSIIVAQRTRELALMRAVGASRGQMIGSVLVEAIVIGLLASVLGLGAGVGVGALLAYAFGSLGGGLEMASVGVPAAAIISAFVVGLFVTVIAAVLPALRASRIPPVAAMQDVATPDRPLTKITVAGAVVGAVGGALLALGLSGNAGDSTLWTILAGVLVTFIGVALLTPLISKPVVALLGRIFSWSVPGKLGRLNSGRNPRRTAITAAALTDIYHAKATAGTISSLGDDQMLVDTDTAKDLGLSVGASLAVQTTRGDAKTYTLSGIYEASELYGGFVLPVDAAKGFAVPKPTQAYLKLAPGTTVAQVQPQVEALLANSPEVSVADRATFIDQQTSSLDGVLQMIQILLALAILIAVLGIVNTLALSVLERTRELGLLRAIGLRRAQTMRMVTVEAVVISMFGAILGVVVGSGLGASVVRALKDQGIDDLVLPWAQMGLFVGVAAIVGVVAAVLPAIRAARLDVLRAIAHE
jgi:ABC-type antimicrobial peptide transport system permease subunit